MKFNLKSRPNCQILSMTGFATRVRETEEWFEGFEKELKELIMTTEKHGFEIIEDILGEKWVYKREV